MTLTAGGHAQLQPIGRVFHRVDDKPRFPSLRHPVSVWQTVTLLRLMTKCTSEFFRGNIYTIKPASEQERRCYDRNAASRDSAKDEVGTRPLGRKAEVVDDSIPAGDSSMLVKSISISLIQFCNQALGTFGLVVRSGCA